MTGTATIEKPGRLVGLDTEESRKMFKMQVDITVRAPPLSGRPPCLFHVQHGPGRKRSRGAEVLRRCPYLELVPMVLEGIVLHPGLTAWPVLDEDGAPVDLSEVEALPFFQPEHLSPQDRTVLGLGDAAEEAMLVERLPHCLRLWHDDNNTGGFFVAQFRHRHEGEETVANAYRSRRSVRVEGNWTPAVKTPPAPTSNSVIQARAEVVEHVQTMYGST